MQEADSNTPTKYKTAAASGNFYYHTIHQRPSRTTSSEVIYIATKGYTTHTFTHIKSMIEHGTHQSCIMGMIQDDTYQSPFTADVYSLLAAVHHLNMTTN
jgi:hypothetical protein